MKKCLLSVFLSVFAVCNLATGAFATSSVSIEQFEDIQQVSSVDANQSEDVQNISAGNVNQRVAPVVVFVGGIVVGYIIDGVAIAATGQSLGDWVASALDYIASYPYSSEVHLSGCPNTGPR